MSSFNVFQKEYIQYRYVDKEPKKQVLLNDLDNTLQSALTLHNYQYFVRNFLNPNTDYKRLFMKWETGAGKTIGSLSIAMQFIKYYKLQEERGDQQIGTVFVIGFSEDLFKKELLRHPEFHFISEKEKALLEKYKRAAGNGSPYEVQRYTEFLNIIRKRFSNRQGYGFFQFIGYRAFLNRVLLNKDNTSILNLSEEELAKKIEINELILNEKIMEKLKNSLIIADEIHNTYNSIDKNNWGTILQMVLDKVDTLRFVALSATPFNNSPTEIISLLNILLP
jgi:superfamily II DNA or RNA helicase